MTIHIRHIYLLLIISLPIVDGILRIRVGAGWEPSIIFGFFLFLICLVVYGRYPIARRTLFCLIWPIILLLISNLFGYFFYSTEFNLNAGQIEQINSVEARILVESVRYSVCAFVFIFTYFYLDTFKKIVTAASAFIAASLIEGLYGIYEFFVKVNGLSSSLPLLRGGEGNTQLILRSYGTFFEPSNFGQFMGCSFLFYLGYLSLLRRAGTAGGFFSKKRSFIFVVFIAAILVSFSRTAFLGLFIGVLFKIGTDILSLDKNRVRISLAWSIGCFVLVAISISVVLHFVSEQFLNRWLLYTFDFSTESTYENTALARSHSFFEMGLHFIELLKQWPLGIGQGMAFIESPFTPFIFRFPAELGVFMALAFIGGVSFLVVKSLDSRTLVSSFSPSLVCLLVCLANYNTTNHIWIWFCFAFFLRVANLRWFRQVEKNIPCNNHN